MANMHVYSHTVFAHTVFMHICVLINYYTMSMSIVYWFSHSLSKCSCLFLSNTAGVHHMRHYTNATIRFVPCLCLQVPIISNKLSISALRRKALSSLKQKFYCFQFLDQLATHMRVYINGCHACTLTCSLCTHMAHTVFIIIICICSNKLLHHVYEHCLLIFVLT